MTLYRFHCNGPTQPPSELRSDDKDNELQPNLQNHHEPLRINSDTIEYVNLDNIVSTVTERVLILTPLRDAAAYLRRNFQLLSELTYPHSFIDLAFLVGDCKDDTLSTLISELESLQHASNTLRFRSATIIEKDFGDNTGQSVEERHSFPAQGTRRRAIGRARNYLLYAALKPVHDWVYWRDVDIVENPKGILEDFMKHDKDVLVPSRLGPFVIVKSCTRCPVDVWFHRYNEDGKDIEGKCTVKVSPAA